MGFLKKITRPISRALDKIVPNEIKPALPFLAAAAPFMAPGLMSLGGNTMLSRALISGGLNLGGQLAQEGSEGDFSALSLAMASGIGALSAPGAGDTLRGIGKTPGATGADAGFYVGEGMNVPESSTSFLGKAADFAGAGADKLEGIIAAGQADPFSMAGVKAASIPLTQGAMDLGIAETRRFNKQQIIDDALGALDDAADDAARASAIRLAMQQYGFTEDEITETISSAGYADGGTVGIMSMKRGLVDGPGGYSGDWITKKSKNWITKKEKFDLADLESLQDDEDEDDNDGIQWIKKKDTSGSNKWIQKKAEGGLMNAKRGLVDEPGGYAGEIAPPLNNKIEGFNEQMLSEYLQGNYPEYEGERVSDYYNRPNFTDVNAVIKIIEMGGDFDDVRETLKIDISDERIKDFIKFDQEKKEKKSSENFYMKDGGLMNLGGREMDMRGGGFIPIGKKERADDVPARLSKNEFVMTADAVRAAGGGSVNKGAKRMYDLMNNLEARV